MTTAEKEEDLWGYQKRLRFVQSVVHESFPSTEPSTIRILDIGCGNGSQLALPLARLGYDVTGIDPDPASIAHASSLAENLPNARFFCASGGDIQETFDVIILSEVLEHVADPAQLLKQGARLLDPKGIAIVTTPNGYGEFEIDSWLFRTLRVQRLVDKLATNNSPLGSTDNNECGHIHFFTRRRLYKIFAEGGFHVWREGAASLFAGPFAGHSLARSQRFIEWNARITDQLPMVFASGWYFALRPDQRLGTAG